MSTAGSTPGSQAARRSSAAAVVNPVAGLPGSRAARRALAGLRARGLAVEILWTTRPGEGRELAARAAERHPVVCAVGGDGTVREVALGLLGTGAALAVLPIGSGNDFARACATPTPAAGAAAVAAGPLARLDVGRIDGRPFFNSAGLFLSGRVSAAAAGLWRGLGRWRYVLAAAAQVGRPRPEAALWRLEGEAAPRGGRWLLAEIGNGPTAGGGFRLTPAADPTDGLLDLCLVRPLPVGQLLRLLPRAAAGRDLDHPAIERPRAAGALLDLPEPTVAHLDGEAGPLAAGRHRLGLEPAALAVVLPPGAWPWTGRVPGEAS